MRTKKLTITTTRRDALAGAVAFISHHSVGFMPAWGEAMLIEGLQSASAAQFEPRPQEGFARRYCSIAVITTCEPDALKAASSSTENDSEKTNAQHTPSVTDS
jgi:hypothetical protein